MTILETLQTFIGILSAVLIIVGLLYWAPWVIGIGFFVMMYYLAVDIGLIE
jgi:hypothetical protein